MKAKRVKTPVVIQMEAVECGAAALGIILAYYRKFISLEELRLECGVSRDGSKANNMLRAARKYGFEAKGYRKELKELKDIKTPFIVFWNFNHFLVVEGFKGDKVYLNDPASGHRTVTMKEFDYGFTGVVLTFEPSEEFQPSGKKPNLFSVFYSRFKGAEIALVFLLLTGIGLAIPNLLVPIFTKIFIDKYLIANLTSWIMPLLIGMAITAVFRGLLKWMQEYFLIKLETKLAIVLSAKFFWHVLQLPITFFSQRSPGDVSSRVELNDDVAIALSRRVLSAILSLILAIFYLSLMFYYDLILTIVVLISATCIVVISEYLNRKRKDLSQSMLSDQSKFMGTSMDGLLVIETLKSSGRESDFFARWSGYQAKYVNTQQKNAAFTYMVTVIPLLLSGINTALILGVGGFQVISGSITIGMLVAFQSLSSSFISPIEDVVAASGEFNDLYGTITRLDDVLNYKKAPNISIAPSTDEIQGASKSPKLEGYLELRNVSFGYSPLDPPLIEDFSLKLAPGHRVALVGGTGSGKSTVAKLIVGLYLPWEGEILFDDQPFEKIPRTIITNSLSMVDQNISMFAGTVRDNITLWDSSIPEQNIIQAAKDACIHEDIVARENGYDGLINEGGTNFSGGQRQRLEIARSLLTAPRILVLDEATSALDPITELNIDHSVRRRGCTAIIVAHRLSTIRDADEIIVLDKGKVVERGTHDSLYEQQGLYSKLIKAT